MSQFYLDTFTDPNATALSAHTAESGHTYSFDAQGASGIEIRGNRASSTNASASYAHAVGTAPSAPAFKVDFVLTRFTSVTDGRAGPFVTEGGDVQAGLFVYWADATSEWQCWTWNTMLDSSTSLPPQVGDTLCRAVVTPGTPARLQLYVYDTVGDAWTLVLDSDNGSAVDTPDAPDGAGIFMRGVMSASTGTHVAMADGESPLPPTMAVQIFTDDFTGTNDDPPNPSKWPTVQVSSGSDASIQSNQLRLQTGGAGSVGGFEDYARLVATHPSVADCRIDFPLTIPSELDNWFSLWSLRGNGLWATDPTFPNFPRVGYWLQIAAAHGSATNAVAFIGKAAADGTTKVDLSAQDGHEMPSGVFDLNARFEVRAENGNVRVLAAVRPQADGPIPEGIWDIDAVDDTGTLFPSAGKLQIGLGGSQNVGDLRTLLLDEITLLSSTAPPAGGLALFNHYYQ